MRKDIWFFLKSHTFSKIYFTQRISICTTWFSVRMTNCKILKTNVLLTSITDSLCIILWNHIYNQYLFTILNTHEYKWNFKGARVHRDSGFTLEKYSSLNFVCALSVTRAYLSNNSIFVDTTHIGHACKYVPTYLNELTSISNCSIRLSKLLSVTKN